MEIKGVLTAEHEAVGLSLVEIGDDYVVLVMKGLTVAIFTQFATPLTIRSAADGWIADHPRAKAKAKAKTE